MPAPPPAFRRRSLRRPVVAAGLVALLAAATASASTPAPELWDGNQPARTRDLTIAPAGDLRLFCVMVGGFRYSTILYQQRAPGAAWSEPAVLPCCRDPRWHHLEPHVAPSGGELFFVTDRPAAGEEEGNEDIWRVRFSRRASPRDPSRLRWREPQRLGAPVNSPAPEFFPSVTRDGTLYFTRRDPDTGAERILRARPRDGGGWREPEALPAAVNAGATRFNAFVDPDERFVIVCVSGHPDNLGAVDYWIAFRDDDDGWRGPVNLGPQVNGPGREGWSPYVSPDGRWFYFMSARDGIDQRDHLTYRRLRALHLAPGNGAGHLWRLPAAFLWALDPGRDG